MTTVYLTVAEVLAIHDDQIERYGGSAGIRDAGQLEAALFRPQTGYYPDLIAEAAALWESLSQNYPFVDGTPAATEPPSKRCRTRSSTHLRAPSPRVNGKFQISRMSVTT